MTSVQHSPAPVEYVRGSFLGSLGAAERDRLLKLGRPRRYPSRSILFFESDDAANVLLLRSGAVKLTINVDGREVLLDVLGAGDLLGELSVIGGTARSATATSLTAVDAVTIPGRDFMHVVADLPTIGQALLVSVAARLRNASRRQVEYGALDAVGRVCRRLIEMVERYGTPGRTGVSIDGPLTQSDIAAWAGLSREAVVKALHGLRRLGWIRTTPRSIVVVDLAAIRSRASLHPIAAARAGHG